MNRKRISFLIFLLATLCLCAFCFVSCGLIDKLTGSDDDDGKVECDHDYVPYTGLGGYIIKQENCVDEGEYKYVCRLCGDEKIEKVKPNPNRHSFDSGTELKKPTCTESGIIVYTCSRCGHTDKEYISPRHTPVPIGTRVEPKCLIVGLTEGSKCSECGEIIEQRKTIPALGHDYNDGVCSRCGDELTYSVRFVAYGDVIRQTTAKAGDIEDLDRPDIPQKAGYKNQSWKAPVLDNIGLSAVIELYFEYIEYDISYINGGAANPNPVSYNVGDGEITLSAVERTGYTFIGWYRDDGGEQTRVMSLPSGTTGDITLTARWTPVEYTITYSGITAEEAAYLPKTYTVETETIQLGTPSARVGYTFEGWTVGGRSVTEIPKGTVGNLVVYGHYRGNSYTLQLNFNGGNATSNRATVEYGSDYSVVVPQKTGNDFVGWFDGTGDDATQYTDERGNSLKEYENLFGITLYAKWDRPRYNVKLYSGVGITYPVQKYYYGEYFVPPANEPTNYGVLFDGWYAPDGTEYTEKTVITGHVDLQARWVKSVAVSTAEQFKAIANEPDGTYHLTADIDLRGNVWTCIPSFTGKLNGRGFTVKNFAVSSTAPGENYGLIAVNEGTIKNIAFADFSFNVSVENLKTVNVGAIVGINKGVLSDIELRGGEMVASYDYTVDSRAEIYCYVNFGGAVGLNDVGGTVEDCKSTIAIEYRLYLGNYNSSTFYMGSGRFLFGDAGGIVGLNKGSVVGVAYEGNLSVDAYARNVTSHGGGYLELSTVVASVGGVIGEEAAGGAADMCYASGEFTFTSRVGNYGHNQAFMGGVVGKNGGAVSDSFAVGTLAGEASDFVRLGGFVGRNASGGDIKSCYALVDVSSDSLGDLGGFCGINEANVQNSFATGSVRNGFTPKNPESVADVFVGGFVGTNGGTGSIGKCFSSGDTSLNSGAVGPLSGRSLGIIITSFYLQGAAVISGGEYIKPDSPDNVTSLPINVLFSEEFLRGTMYWDEESWVILTDSRPMLEWEIAIGHVFTTETEEPDCEHGGFTIYSCADCGMVFIKDYVPAVGHKFVVERTVDPTCTERGYTVRKCSVCGKTENVDYTDPTGHPSDRVTVKSERAATCTEGGLTVYHCDACGNDCNETSEALGHDGTFVSVSKAPTCTECGQSLYRCERCHAEYTVETECAEHSWIDVDYKPATCGIVRDSDGNIIERNPVAGSEPGRKCSVCGHIDYGCEEIAPHSFTLVETVTAATCEHAGLGRYRCDICELEIEVEIARLDHTDADKNFVCDVCEELLFTDSVLASFTKITSLDGLRNVVNNPSKNYWLDVDIDLTGQSWTPLGSADRPFRGIFFGNNHTIKGLSFAVNDGDTAFGGVFGYNSGTILCLNISGFTVDATNTDIVFGGVVAYNSGTVKYCSLVGDSVVYAYTELTVTDYAAHRLESDGSTIGGIVGINLAGASIENCSLTGTLKAYVSNKSNVRSERVASTVLSLIKSASAYSVQNIALGGIVGRNAGKTTSCRVEGGTEINLQVKASLSWLMGKATAVTHLYAGALVGYNGGTIENCRALTMKYNPLDVQTEENTQTKRKATLYELEVGYFNHCKTDGTDGLIGASEKSAVVKDVAEIV